MSLTRAVLLRHRPTVRLPVFCLAASAWSLTLDVSDGEWLGGHTGALNLFRTQGDRIQLEAIVPGAVIGLSYSASCAKSSLAYSEVYSVHKEAIHPERPRIVLPHSSPATIVVLPPGATPSTAPGSVEFGPLGADQAVRTLTERAHALSQWYRRDPSLGQRGHLV